MSRAQNHKETRRKRKLLIPERTLFLDKESLIILLKKMYGDKGINLHAEKNLSLKPEILAHTSWINSGDWAERVFCLISGIEVQPTCSNCGDITKFAQRNIGYHTFCSRKCSAEYNQTKEKRASTNITKYGDPVAFRNDTVKKKQKETLISRYGATNSWHLIKKQVAYSKISQELFWNAWSNSKQYGLQYFAELNQELILKIDGKIIKPDYAQIDGDDKRIIEFDGDYWHCGQDAKIRDFNRDIILKNDGWRILRIKESSYIKDKEEMTLKCIAFLNKWID